MSQDTQTKEQIDYYLGRIKDMLRRVPDSVNGGSYETAVAFKKLAVQASKAVGQSNPKLVVLTQIYSQLSVYYK
jgi:hypothetical protein